jgi:hypothetical protein
MAEGGGQSRAGPSDRRAAVYLRIASMTIGNAKKIRCRGNRIVHFGVDRVRRRMCSSVDHLARALCKPGRTCAIYI